MLGAELLSIGGAAICGLVGVKMLASVADSLQRISADRTRFRLRNQALNAELERLGRIATTTDSTEAWQGWRKFRVQSKQPESADCHSICLVPHDGKPLPSFKPGQYLTFSVRIPGESAPVVRCYSLSDSPASSYYRVSVKKVPPRDEHPPGRVSNYFNDHLQVGDILDVKAPRGAFFLDMTREDPIVLLAGGVGITPLLSMLNTIVASGSRRAVYMFCGFREGSQHLFKSHLQKLAQEHSNIKICSVYSNPRQEDVQGRDYDLQGYVNLDVLRQVLPSNNFQFYLCGPGPFMNSLDQILRDWGVPGDSIKSEAFGPASVNKPKPAQPAAEPASKVQVLFSRSGKTAAWSPDCESLLELAESQGIPIDSGCRAGNCGTCVTAVKRGQIQYNRDTDHDPSDGTCLTCIATPQGDIELDA